jgi:uncharacterized membrane protein YczE
MHRSRFTGTPSAGSFAIPLSATGNYPAQPDWTAPAWTLPAWASRARLRRALHPAALRGAAWPSFSWRRAGWFTLGRVGVGIGCALMMRASVGTGAWDAASMAVAGRTGIPAGMVGIAVALLCVLLALPLGGRPCAGTIVCAWVSGAVLDAVMPGLPVPTPGLAQHAMFGAGLLVNAIGSGIYLASGMGRSGYDLLRTGMATALRTRVSRVTWALEFLMLAIAVALHATLGFGTAAIALVNGPLVLWTAARMERRAGGE